MLDTAIGYPLFWDSKKKKTRLFLEKKSIIFAVRFWTINAPPYAPAVKLAVCVRTAPNAITLENDI
jgi:hypothetical protein